MSRTLQIETTILPGHRIEVQSPELPIGEPATVVIVLGEAGPPKRRLSEVLAGYVPGQAFRSAEEVDEHIRAERDAWGS